MLAMAAQSPELMDECPIDDIGYNRAVRRPMSLTEFPSTPASPRFPGSRHSMYSTGRRPLRSSPLAGPALRVDEAIEEVDEKRNQQSRLPGPSRVLSTPNLVTLLTLPPPLRHARPKTAESHQEGFGHVSISSPPAEPSKCSSSLFSQRRNSEVGPPLQSPLPPSSSSLPPSRSASSLSLRRHPAKPGHLRGSNHDKESLTPPPIALQRPKSAHGYPTVRLRPITTIPEKQLENDCMIPTARSRCPKDNSWFTANTYQVTPKFSRLGLAAEGVVLPVSAKEHRRLSRPSSRSSMSSGAPMPSVRRPMDSESSLSVSSPSPSTPDVNLTDMQQDGSGVITPTLTRSSVSSQCSDDSSETPPDIPLTNSAHVAIASTDSTTSITTIMDGDPPDGSSPLSKDRVEQEPQSQKIAAAISSKKNKLMQFKILQYRTSLNSFNPIHHTSINRQSKLDCPEASERRKGSDRRRTAGRSEEINLGLKFSWFTSSESSLSDETDSKRGRLLPVENSSRMKRLWKSIAVNW